MMSNDELLSVLLSGESAEIRHALSGRDLNLPIEGRPALLWLISGGATDAVLSLIAAGADPNVRAESGETALVSASYPGNPRLVAALVQAGADPNASDGDGQSALMAAAKSGNLETVQQLVSAGADVGKQDSRGRGVLHWALTEGDHAEVVEYLLKKGASKQQVSQDETSPHDYARMLSRSKCLPLLE